MLRTWPPGWCSVGVPEVGPKSRTTTTEGVPLRYPFERRHGHRSLRRGNSLDKVAIRLPLLLLRNSGSIRQISCSGLTVLEDRRRTKGSSDSVPVVERASVVETTARSSADELVLRAVQISVISLTTSRRFLPDVTC